MPNLNGNGPPSSVVAWRITSSSTMAIRTNETIVVHDFSISIAGKANNPVDLVRKIPFHQHVTAKVYGDDVPASVAGGLSEDIALWPSNRQRIHEWKIVTVIANAPGICIIIGGTVFLSTKFHAIGVFFRKRASFSARTTWCLFGETL